MNVIPEYFSEITEFQKERYPQIGFHISYSYITKILKRKDKNLWT